MIHNKTKKNKTKKNNTKKNNTNNVYTDEEYNSGDGMLTTVWGPSMWHYLHTMSFNYPVEPTLNEKKKLSEFCY